MTNRWRSRSIRLRSSSVAVAVAELDSEIQRAAPRPRTAPRPWPSPAPVGFFFTVKAPLARQARTARSSLNVITNDVPFTVRRWPALSDAREYAIDGLAERLPEAATGGGGGINEGGPLVNDSVVRQREIGFAVTEGIADLSLR